MKIQSYNVSMSSLRAYEQRDESVEEIRQWGRKDSPEKNENSEPQRRGRRSDRANISARARQIFEAQAVPEKIVSDDSIDEYDPEKEIRGDARMLTLKKMIEFITGRKINLTSIFEPQNDTDKAVSENQSVEQPAEGVEEEQGWGMSYSSYQSHYEYEKTSFAASGVVQTADGKEIQFSLNMEMTREYFTEESFEMSAGEPLIDPLVINYSGNAAELSDMHFEFDINADGKNENIRHLQPGSGFLVFDRNEDGIINDGSEMFGPTTGDGFSELAAYDDDNNNWIDENDSIYEKLSLWNKGENVDYITGLKDADVGAIYLGNVNSQFDLKGSTNELYGRIQKAGMYLSDSGKAGTVQQIDFAI